MSYALYAVGFVVLIAGLAWAASMAGLPETWIWVGVVVMVGIAILGIASRMNEREPPPPPPPPRSPPPPSNPPPA